MFEEFLHWGWEIEFFSWSSIDFLLDFGNFLDLPKDIFCFPKTWCILKNCIFAEWIVFYGFLGALRVSMSKASSPWLGGGRCGYWYSSNSSLSSSFSVSSSFNLPSAGWTRQRNKKPWDGLWARILSPALVLLLLFVCESEEKNHRQERRKSPVW